MTLTRIYRSNRLCYFAELPWSDFYLEGWFSFGVESPHPTSGGKISQTIRFSADSTAMAHKGISESQRFRYGHADMEFDEADRRRWRYTEKYLACRKFDGFTSRSTVYY